MAIRNLNELTETFNSMFSEDDLNGDTQLGFLEDLTDTINAGAENMQWKQKYEDNDKEWREKYRRRFMSGGEEGTPTPNDPPLLEDPEDEATRRATTVKIKDLFEPVNK